MILKKIDLETPSDPVGWRCVERDRLIKSLDGRSKQKIKEERGRERKKEGGGCSIFTTILYNYRTIV
jgi:hypothetical protein